MMSHNRPYNCSYRMLIQRFEYWSNAFSVILWRITLCIAMHYRYSQRQQCIIGIHKENGMHEVMR